MASAFFKSSIGLKVIMAVSGIALILFVVGHLLGNLQVFLGQEVFNDYAEFLKSIPGPLWAARIGLLVMLVLHIVSAVKLKQRNRDARPERYQHEDTVRASLASRTMFLTGVLILAFIIYHLCHLTWGVILPDNYSRLDGQGRHDVYTALVLGFLNPAVAASYIFFVAVLGFHLSHAIASFFQTLGFNHPRYTPCIERAGSALAVIIALAYISIPVSVYAKVITLPVGVVH